MVQPFFRRPESSTAILIAATELAPPMSAYRLDMSFSTPILTVLSWARAGAARPNPAQAISAAVHRASVVFIDSLQMLTPGWLSSRNLTKGLIDQTIPWFAITLLAPRRNALIVARPRLVDALSGIDVSGINVAWEPAAMQRSGSPKNAAPNQRCRSGAHQVTRLAQRVRGQFEFLDALSGIDLGGIDVALGVDRHGVDPVELPGVTSVAAKTADHRAILALQHPDFVVLAIGAQQKSLLRIGPDRDIPYRAIAERVLLIKPFLHEGAVLLEHLDAVVDAVADIDEAIIGDFHAMHGIGELLRHRRLGIVGRLLGVVAALARRDLADLRHELAVEGEFQDRVVVVGIAADPDKTAFVDFDAVLASDPFIAFAGPAPRAQEIAVGVELQHRRRRHAAFRARRRQRCTLLVVGQRARAVDNPDMTLPVDGDAANLAENPVVGQWLWPGRIDREGRNLAGMSVAWQRGRADQRGGGDEDGGGSGNAMLHRRHGILPYFSLRVFSAWRAVNSGEAWESIGRCSGVPRMLRSA